MADVLIEHKIPILMLYGTEDMTVLYNQNGALLEEAYKDADGLLSIIQRKNQGHHPHGFPQKPEMIVDFILKHTEIN